MSKLFRLFGFVPKVAFLSHSTFGEPATDRTKRLSDAVNILKNSDWDAFGDGYSFDTNEAYSGTRLSVSRLSKC